MPLPFGSFCVLRVTLAPDDLFQQKKTTSPQFFVEWFDNCSALDFVSSFFRVTMSLCHRVRGRPAVGSVSFAHRCLIFLFASLDFVFSSLPVFLRLLCSRFDPLVLLSFGSRPFFVLFIFQFSAFPLLGIALQLFSGQAPFFLTLVDRLLFH